MVPSLNPPRQPMFWAALAYCLGIVSGRCIKGHFSIWIVAVTILLGIAVYFRNTRIAAFLVLAGFFVVGAWHIQIQGGTVPRDHTLDLFDGQQIEFTAHVTREGGVHQEGTELRQTIDVETEDKIDEIGHYTPLRSGLRLVIYDHNVATSRTILHYGQRISVPVKIRIPRNFRNPGAFDYEGYLASNKIAAVGSAKAEDLKILSGFVGTRIELWRARIHSSIVSKVQALWPAPQAALLDAMLIGEDAFIDRDTRADFQRSGTYHVLVVSGMNVTILAFVVFWALRRLRLPDIPATLLTIAFCVAYAFITQVGAPVWRATLMCAIYLCTRLLYRERAMVNALGVAALGVLLFDPRQLFTASFQMTFLCVLIVSAIAIPLAELSSQRYRRALAHWNSDDYGPQLPPCIAQFRLDLRLIAERLGQFIGDAWSLRTVRGIALIYLGIFELLLVSALMQMGLALPMAYYFHRATTIGLPANAAVVPLTQMLMPAALVTVCTGYILPTLAKIPALLTTLVLQAITGTVYGLGGLRLADLRVATPSRFTIAATLLALAFAITCARKRKLLALCGVLALLLTSLTVAFIPPKPRSRPNTLEVTAIDVGEGDSILVVTPEGRALLVDAGGPIWGAGSQLDFGEDVVAPYLWNRGISHLDAVAISHAHSDHIGGMPAILRDFRPNEIWIGLQPPSRALESLIAEANALGTKVVRHWEGDEFSVGGAKVDVLFPPQNWPVGLEPKNNDSTVLFVTYGATSVLLEGDAEKAVERRIATLHPLHADLLKVGHHGSVTSTTPEVLQAVRPTYAIISVGYHNLYGLPKETVLARLRAAGIQTYRTDLDGAVSFFLDGRSVTPELATQQ